MPLRLSLHVFSAFCLVFAFGTVALSQPPPERSEALLSNWEVEQGFALDVHASGFEYPTALAFVPEPGEGPDAPLYFVTELRGRVKVVTRSGEVHVFAEGFSDVRDQTTTPGRKFVESGTAGLCLAPEAGYVFVTYVFRGERGALRNGMMRFSSEPGRFSLQERGRLDLSKMLRGDSSYESHQIGPCQVEDRLLYVAVGDAFKLEKSRRLNSTLGKILRMDLDGKSLTSNPFYHEPMRTRAVSYVWAYGLRNPFGLEVVDGRVFVAENGPDVDRFIEVERGEKLLWDGSNWSLGTNALVVFAPSVSPVQLDLYPRGSSLFPEPFRDRFYLALSGSLGPAGPGAAGEKSIVMLHYDFERRRMKSPPQTFVRYRGKPLQALTALAFGPDGLYFAPLLPDAAGQSPVLRVRYAPDDPHPFVLGESNDPVILMEEADCLSCHQLGGRGGTAGPSLDTPPLAERLLERLGSAEYLQSLAELDANPDEPYASERAARREVAEAEGMERVRTWMRHRLREPRFDSSTSAMPKSGLSERKAKIVVDFLLEGRGNETIAAEAEDQGEAAMPKRAPGRSPLMLVAAFGLGVVATLLAGVALRRRGPRG